MRHRLVVSLYVASIALMGGGSLRAQCNHTSAEIMPDLRPYGWETLKRFTEFGYYHSNVTSQGVQPDWPIAYIAVDEAFEDWDPLISDIEFTSGANILGAVYYYYAFWPHGQDDTAITTMTFDENGVGKGWIISVNFTNFPTAQWSLHGSSTHRSMHATGLHEVGHVLRLRHVESQTAYDCQTVMVPSYQGLAAGHSEAPKDWDTGAIALVYPDLDDENSAARLHGFKVIDGVATWNVPFEWETLRYEIEGCVEPEGPGELVASTGAGIGEHSAVVPSGRFPLFRLVEVETNGRRVPKRVAAPSRAAAIDKQRKKGDLTAWEGRLLNMCSHLALRSLSSGELPVREPIQLLRVIHGYQPPK